MPRNYTKKTKPKYSLEDLHRATEEVRCKRLTFGQASTQYSVPKSTLFKQVNQSEFREPKKGRHAVFTKEEEGELKKYILDCCKTFYGITPTSLRRIAFKFAEANNLKHNFNKELQKAGKDWYYSFMRRHPSISLRTPEATSLNRITAFNATEVKLFFDQLEALLTRYNFSAHRIFNIDETGISTVQKNSKILAPKGSKQVAKATSGERGVTTTVVCAVSANGTYVPPMFIFKRKRMSELLIKGCDSNMIATVSDSGWINESIFIDYLRHFISFVKPSKEDPVLIILDNHESHVSLGAYQLYRENSLHVLSLPPHVSHKMQPLDLTIFSSLKMAYNRECELYMVNNPGKRITQYEVGELFTNAYNKIANISKAINVFKAAGIYPIDSDKFKDCFENLSVHKSVVSQTQENTPSASETAVETRPTERQDAPSASENEINLNVIINTTPPSPGVRLNDIVNVPVIPKILTNSKRQNKKHSQILSSTPVKRQLEEKQERQIKKKIKKEQVSFKNANKNVAVEKRSKVRSKVVKNLKNAFEEKENDVEYFCIFCSEKFEFPPTEDWIMCVICNNWAHEKCTSGESSKGYMCDFCQTK